MGIDIFLIPDSYDNIPEDDKIKLFNDKQGFLGYLRESYRGAPYATRLFLREAFCSTDRCAKIPAAELRKRMTEKHDAIIATAPTFAEALSKLLQQKLKNQKIDDDTDSEELIKNTLAEIKNDKQLCDEEYNRQTLWAQSLPTQMSVVEAITLRKKLIEHATDEELQETIQSYYDFIDRAERQEKETGRLPTIYADY